MSFWIGIIFGAVAGAGVAMVLMPRSESLERSDETANSIELKEITEGPAIQTSTQGGNVAVKGGIYVRQDS